MLNNIPCCVHGCPNSAISTQDVCYNHITDKEAYWAQARASLAEHPKLSWLNLAHITFKDMDLSDKQFFFTSFSHCRFINISTKNQIMHLCFFDYSVLDNCEMVGPKHTNCVFAGAQFHNTIIKDAVLFQSNYNNCVLRNVSIVETDLYNARFIGSHLENVNFFDCNLKNVDFRHSRRHNVTFRYSNFEDAIFDEKDEA